MIKTKLTVLSLLVMASNLFGVAPKYELKTTTAQLVIDQKNNLMIVDNSGAIQLRTTLAQLWSTTLKRAETGAETSFGPNGDAAVRQGDGMIHIKATAGTDQALQADLTIAVRDDAFHFGGSVRAAAGWNINDLTYPVFDDIRFKKGKAGVYWPAGLGQYFENPDDFKNKSARYPSGLTMAMPWYSLNQGDAGLYIGSHDPAQETKVFDLDYDKNGGIFRTKIKSDIFDSEYSIPDMVIRPYSGDWHVAAKHYRSWYDQHFELPSPPEWVKDDSGWLLAILKQQNMEIMWPYDQLDKLCDIAEAYNLGTVALFGWGFGGHDHLYPFYTPDNTMGGRSALEAAIKRAQQRGIKIIIYANGKIMDTSTDFYAYYGHETMVIQKNLQPQIQYYIKQRGATPVIFAQACDGSDVWRRTMYDLAVQAASLGADGILYDQLGVMGVSACYSPYHDHKPGLTDSKNRLDMANQARIEARKINPEFIVMTEGTHDQVIQGIDYHHGCGVAYQPSSKHDFPALFRYTFPELITTQRNPNPMITRTDANFAAIHGMRHEIESRYPGDVEYLLNGTLPTKETYANQVSPPDIRKMNLESAEKSRQYVHSLIEFEKKNANFFCRGQFIDEAGFDATGTDILAKGFVSGNQLGVVVWNQHLTESRAFSLEVPGYTLKNAQEPNNTKADALAALSPNTVRLIVYEKN